MKTILLADDSRNIRDYCRGELEDEGYRVVAVADGSEALVAFFEQLPSVVVLDISMPRMDGLEVLARIRSLAPDFPVILFTACDEDYAGDARIRLATACLEKSADLGELKRVIARAAQTGAGPKAEASRHLRAPLAN